LPIGATVNRLFVLILLGTSQGCCKSPCSHHTQARYPLDSIVVKVANRGWAVLRPCPLPTDLQASEIDGIMGCGSGSGRKRCERRGGDRETEEPVMARQQRRGITMDKSCHRPPILFHPIPSPRYPRQCLVQVRSTATALHCTSNHHHQQQFSPISPLLPWPPPAPRRRMLPSFAPARGPLSHVVALAATTWVGACSNVEMCVLAWTTCWSCVHPA
jgi:hypothetical protein